MTSTARPLPEAAVPDWRAAVGAGPLIEDAREAQLNALAPLLVDTRFRESVAVALEKLGPSRIRGTAGLCYAQGYLHARAGDSEAATTMLMLAESLPAPVPLAARTSAELGYLYISRGQAQAAEAVLLGAQGRIRAAGGSLREPDLVHLEALIADWQGDRRRARELHKECLAMASRALTPLTRVLCLSNLAVAVAHQHPEDAVSLGRLAIGTVETEGLNPRFLPALRNATGYAALITGRLDEARILLAEAMEGARFDGNRQIELFSCFNLAIHEELLGRPMSARKLLHELAEKAQQDLLPALVAWGELRLRWLGDTPAPAPASSTSSSGAASPELGAAFDELAGIEACRRGDLADARRMLGRARSRHAETEDDLSLFVTDLWLAHVEYCAGRHTRARQLVQAAARLGRLRGFALATNWWAPEILATARALATGSDGRYVSSLHAAYVMERDSPIANPPPVVVRSDGTIVLDGVALTTEIWREGRSGPNVLRRLFCLLRLQYPGALGREALADELWPDSDGDRAARNLHATMHDLRRALSAVPGVRVATVDQTYRLELSPNVTVEPPAGLNSGGRTYVGRSDGAREGPGA